MAEIETTTKTEQLAFEFKCFPVDRLKEGALAEDTEETADGLYHFRFQVTLTNKSDSAFSVVSRQLEIKEGDGTEVAAPKQQLKQSYQIEPGRHFQFNGTISLTMPIGQLRCHFLLQTLENKNLRVSTPEFVFSNRKHFH